jgi:hypothetical protein
LRLNILKIIYAVHLKNANLRRYSIGLPNFYCTKDKRTFSYFVTDSYYSFDICKLILQDFCLVLIIVLRCVLFHYLHVYVNQVITGHVCVRIMVQALFTSSPGQRKRKYNNEYIIYLYAEIHCNEKIYISSVLTLCTLSEI